MASSQHKSSRKREKRTRAALPVRVNFMNDGFSEQACTLNITTKGARIAGLTRSPSMGDFIEVQRGAKKNIFRIVWVGEPGSTAEGQIGVVCENESIRIWEAELLKGQGFEPVEQLPESLPEAPVRRPQKLITAPHRQKSGEEPERTGPPALLLIIGSLLFLVLGFFLGRQSRRAPPAPAPAVDAATRSQIDARDAAQIHDLQQWRIADVGDFGPNGISWMKNQGIDPSGIVSFRDLSQAGTAYIFASTDPTSSLKRRVLLFVNHELHYDTSMPQIFAFAVVPADNLAQVTWQAGSRAVAPTGDGVMVIRDGNDPSSAIIFEVSGTRIVPRQPANFRAVSLQTQ